ncbi:MAG TPA: methionine--tRNA ligase [Elusimicrobiota bacterium]|nr:methionine--tRNA ligase [Elusimicrobiota bacterium]
MKKKFITTPIYYVNAAPHLGHAYTTIAADVYARYLRMRGEKVYFLTGTDEHGSKIEEAAKAAGVTPKAFADDASAKFRDLWRHLDVRYDDFIRTTEPRHTARVQAVFTRLLATGDIYKGVYRGYYCVSDETYWTETEAPENDKGKRLCPNPECKRLLTVAEEESYFFKLSKYQPALLKHYQANPDFLRPAHRANEILRFVEAGLRDLAVSRSKVAWGIPLPFAPNHVAYVWFDALLNYATAAGYNPPGAESLPPAETQASPGAGAPAIFPSLWPADVHFVGKEIYRFHAVIWPAMLMALGLELPKSVFAHGWWTVEGQKMSKSKKNFVDPWEVTREFGVDAFRYFLFREMPFGNDGDYSAAMFRKRYNADLANDLGNLVSRVTQMVDKFLGGELPGRTDTLRLPKVQELSSSAHAIHDAMERLDFYEALNKVWAGIGVLNQYVNTEAPWKWAAQDPDRLKALLFDLVSSLRLVAGWIEPFMPNSAAQIQAQLGVRQFPAPLTAEEVMSRPQPGARIFKGPALFPRK